MVNIPYCCVNNIRATATQMLSQTVMSTADKDSAMRKYFWIDTDAGIDDAHAILMALADPTVTIIGISTIRGNTSCSQVARNVLRLLRVSDCLQVT